MDDSSGIIAIVGLIIRVIGTIVCVNKAKELNRDTTGWGIFGFFLPIIAMIWVHCIKPKMIWDNNSEIKKD